MPDMVDLALVREDNCQSDCFILVNKSIRFISRLNVSLIIQNTIGKPLRVSTSDPGG
jgi:hypothetical protein